MRTLSCPSNRLVYGRSQEPYDAYQLARSDAMCASILVRHVSPSTNHACDVGPDSRCSVDSAVGQHECSAHSPLEPEAQGPSWNSCEPYTGPINVVPKYIYIYIKRKLAMDEQHRSKKILSLYMCYILYTILYGHRYTIVRLLICTTARV